MPSNQPITIDVLPEHVQTERADQAGRASGASQHSRKRLALAFGIALVSDAVSFWTEFVPPVQWAVDVATAGALFLVLGRRWAILPALIAEAIPGLAVFPIWLLVVLSIVVYDDVRAPKRSRVI